MSYSLASLQAEYTSQAATADVRPEAQVRATAVAKRLLGFLPRYKTIERLTGVPAVVTMCIHERESGGNWNTYLGNGQPLSKVTTMVPVGRGPFATFEAGAIDAYRIQGLLPDNWTVAALCYWMEKFNGFGYRNRGIRSPYVWGGTTLQQPGKYVRDSVFDPNVWDTQLGGMAVYLAIVALDPSLRLTGTSVPKPAPTPAPPTSNITEDGWFVTIIKAIFQAIFGVRK